MLLALCIAAIFFLRARHFAPTEKAMQWPDALGLGLFSATGTQLALAQDLPGIVAVLMGVITATFGGAAARRRLQRDPHRVQRSPAVMRSAPSSAAGCWCWRSTPAWRASLATMTVLAPPARLACGRRGAAHEVRCRGGPR